MQKQFVSPVKDIAAPKKSSNNREYSINVQEFSQKHISPSALITNS